MVNFDTNARHYYLELFDCDKIPIKAFMIYKVKFKIRLKNYIIKGILGFNFNNKACIIIFQIFIKSIVNKY